VGASLFISLDIDGGWKSLTAINILRRYSNKAMQNQE
jgi:hypothetical protein